MTRDVYIHPTAIVETDAIGAGTRIWAFTHLLAGACIGAYCNVGDHCFIESGVVIGDNVTIKNGNAIWDGITLEDGVFVGPGVVFTNDLRPRSPRLPEARLRYEGREWLVPTRVGRGSTIGAGAVILAGVTIGEFGFVGAGSLVTRDVEPHALVVGSPVRRQSWVCRCGGALQPAEPPSRCSACGRPYEMRDGRVVERDDG